MLVLAPLALASAACKPRGEATDAPFTADSARKRAAELERTAARGGFWQPVTAATAARVKSARRVIGFSGSCSRRRGRG